MCKTIETQVRNRAKVRDFGSYSSDMNYGMVDVLHMLELLGDNSDTAKGAIGQWKAVLHIPDTNMEKCRWYLHLLSLSRQTKTTRMPVLKCRSILNLLRITPVLQDFYAIQNGDTLLADREISNAHTTVTTQKMTAPMMKAISRLHSRTAGLILLPVAITFSARPKKKVTYFRRRSQS